MKPLRIALGSLVVVAVASSAGCSKPTEPAPAPSVPVQPTEKAVTGNINLPPRAFDQNMNAADGILALESEGYNVEINWGGGPTDQSLSQCRIGAVDGMRGSGAVKPGTTVYVTVNC